MAQVSIVFQTPSFATGIFLCPPTDTRWKEENWIGTSHLLAFPRRAVLIEKSRRQRVVANSNNVVLYNPDETYRRSLLAPEGDESTFITLHVDVVREFLPVARDASTAAFPAPELRLSNRAALRLHALELWIRRLEPEREPGLGDELTLDLISQVFGEESPAGTSRRPARTSTDADQRALVDDTRAVLSITFREPLSLAQVARLVGSSPFHLARIFRATTGRTVHGYREQLRLREALRRVKDGERDLARIATDLGFASHSHFTDRFRIAFAASPSSVRGLDSVLGALTAAK